jgi:hypothetical protein
MPRTNRSARVLGAVLLGGALALAAVFAVRLVLGLAGWTIQPQDPVAGWMPLGYIARAWDVPAPDLGAALGIEPGSSPGRSLERIAREQAIPLPEAIARIEAAIAAARARTVAGD